MATLKPTLTLTSTSGSSGVSEDASLALSVTDSLTVTDPSIGVSRVAAIATGTGTQILPDVDAVRYIYVKNTGLDGSDVATTANVQVRTGGSLGVVTMAQLDPDEFMFMPFYGGGPGEVDALASTGTVVIEYAYFTKG